MKKKDIELIKRNLDIDGMPDDESPEWTISDFKTAKKGLDGLAEIIGEQRVAHARKIGRPRVASPKKNGTLRLAADLWEKIKSTGKGYNSRVEMVLREALASGRI